MELRVDEYIQVGIFQGLNYAQLVSNMHIRVKCLAKDTYACIMQDDEGNIEQQHNYDTLAEALELARAMKNTQSPRCPHDQLSVEVKETRCGKATLALEDEPEDDSSEWEDTNQSDTEILSITCDLCDLDLSSNEELKQRVTRAILGLL